MQKLSAKLKNTPIDASLVCSSVRPVLNKDQSLSVQDTVLTDNNLEVNHQQQRAGQNLTVSDIVFVLNQEGQPLMPCRHKKAKNLLREGRAKVIKRKPFTIQLLYRAGNNKQEIDFGLDPGFQNIGFSASTSDRELISGTLNTENGMKKRLDEKRMYRKNRRSRLWHREARFNNKKRKEGSLRPSVQRRLDTHINLVKRVMRILPITRVHIESNNFDIQRINNPNIEGKGYQQGDLYGYKNLQSYIISREQGKCQICGEEYKEGWHLHHIIPRSRGGTDKSSNIALLHKDCHKRLHKDGFSGELKKSKQYKSETFMNIIRQRLVDDIEKLLPTRVTFGYITNIKRNRLNFDKTHYNDAFVISGAKDQERCNPITITQKKRNNRCLQLNRRGFKPSIRRQRYDIQPKDLIWVKGKQYISRGVGSYGRYIYYGNNKKDCFRLKDIEKCFHFGGFIF